MGKRPYLRHLETVERALERMKGRKPFIFAAACAERLLPVYVRAADGAPWNSYAALRRVIDDVWNWCGGQGPAPHGLAVVCDAAILDEPEDDVSNVAARVATALFGLASSVEEGLLEGCAQSADNNLGLVEAFVYEQLLDLNVTPDNDIIVDRHVLMTTEMQRQVLDLGDLAGDRSIESEVSLLRDRSKGQSVLGEHWFRASE